MSKIDDNLLAELRELVIPDNETQSIYTISKKIYEVVNIHPKLV